MRHFINAFLGALIISICSSGFAAEHKGLDRLTITGKKVALTFDDGPDDNVIPILDMLAKAGGKATFFFKGSNVDKQPEVAQKVIAAGSEIGNHSYTHPWFNAPSFTADMAREEVEKTQQVIKEKTGFTPVLFRAPYIRYTDALWAVLDELQLTAVNSNVVGNDWEKTATSLTITERVTKQVSPGGIVLLHSWPPCTVQALPDIITFLKDNGYEMVTVSELIKLSNK